MQRRLPGSVSECKPRGLAPPNSAPTPSEIVTRPEPGLGRGVWEARPWQLYAILVAILVFAGAYGAVRSGLGKRLKRRKMP